MSTRYLPPHGVPSCGDLERKFSISRIASLPDLSEDGKLASIRPRPVDIEKTMPVVFPADGEVIFDDEFMNDIPESILLTTSEPEEKVEDKKKMYYPDIPVPRYRMIQSLSHLSRNYPSFALPSMYIRRPPPLYDTPPSSPSFIPTAEERQWLFRLNQSIGQREPMHEKEFTCILRLLEEETERRNGKHVSINHAQQVAKDRNLGYSDMRIAIVYQFWLKKLGNEGEKSINQPDEAKLWQELMDNTYFRLRALRGRMFLLRRTIGDVRKREEEKRGWVKCWLELRSLNEEYHE